MALPQQLLDTLDGIARAENTTRSAVLKNAVEQYAEGVRVRDARKFLRDSSDEEVTQWLKEDRDSEKVVWAIKASAPDRTATDD